MIKGSVPSQKDELRLMRVGHRGGIMRAAATLLLSFILIEIYESAIVPIFSYSGLVWDDLHLGFLVVSIGAVAATSLFLPNRMIAPAQFVVTGLFILVLIPVGSIPLVSGILDPSHALMLSFVACACFAVLSLACQKSTQRTGSTRLGLREGVFVPIALIVSLVVLTVIYASAGFHIQAPDFGETHDTRLEFRDLLATSSPVLAYAVPLSVKVLNPLVLVLGLQLRSFAMVGLGLIGQLSIFTLNGQRSILVGTLGTLVVFFVFRRWKCISSGRLILWACLFILATWTIYEIIGSSFLMSLFVRRLIVIPGALTGVYFDYYDSSNYAGFRHSRLLSPGEAEPPPSRVIGEYFAGSADLAANANFLADGYANFGWMGVAAFTGVLALLLICLNRVATGLPNEIVFALVVGPTFALSDTALFTTMLTHGLMALLVILIFYPRPGARDGLDEQKMSSSLSRLP